MTSLTDIPVEILEQIAKSLNCPNDVLNLASTCTSLRLSIYANDRIWQRLLLARLNIWSSKFTENCLKKLGSSNDLESVIFQSQWMTIFRKLYAHRWAKPSVWIGDRVQFGCFLISMFDYELGVFMVKECACTKASKDDYEFNRFSANELIEIHPYDPAINVLDPPLMVIDPDRIDYSKPESLHDLNIHPLHVDNDNRYMSINLLRTRPLASSRIHKSMSVWPPLKIPSENRVRNNSATEFRGQTTPEYPCEDIIRIRTSFPHPRQRSNFNDNNSNNNTEEWPTRLNPATTGLLDLRTIQISKLETFFRLDNKQLSAPSPTEQSYKGLWIADLGGAGELLLITHPDKRVLEAVKITANVTVPRGELEFIVHDVTKIVPITYNEWPGCPVVESLWQTSRLCYADATFVESQLILISPNLMVHYRPDDESLVYLKRVTFDACKGTLNT